MVHEARNFIRNSENPQFEDVKSDNKESISTNKLNSCLATCRGRYSIAATAGDYSAAETTEDYSISASAGRWAVAVNTGNFSIAVSTGHSCSAAESTGNHSTAITNDGSASVTGKNSIAAALGMFTRAKGTIGNRIVLTEYHDTKKETH